MNLGFKFNITQKFIAYLMLFSVIPLLVVGAIATAVSTTQLSDEIDRYARQVVIDQLDYLQLQQAQIESLLINIAGVESIRDALRMDADAESDSFTRLSTQAEIGYILNGYVNIEGLVSIDIFTTSGVHYTVGDTLVSDVIRDDIQERIFEIAVDADGSIVWVGVEDNVNTASNAEQVTTAAVALYEFDRDTQERLPIALLMVNFNPNALYTHFNAIDLSENGYMVVLDGEGRYIYHPERELIGLSAQADLINNLDSSSIDNVSTLDSIRVNDEEMMVSYMYSDISGWAVASLIPSSNIAAQTASIRNTIILVMVVSLAFVIIMSVVYSRGVVVPIRALIGRFQHLQANPDDVQQHLPPRGQDEIGQLIQWFNLFLDNLNEKQQVEAEREQMIYDLRIANHRAEESTRLKSEFLATMSHELRTPLNAIIGYSQILLVGMAGELSEEQRGFQERVLINSQHLLQLINEVLDLSKIEAGRLELVEEPFNIHDLLSDVIKQNRILAEDKNLELESKVASDLPLEIIGDAVRIRQIIINLVSNAIKFTDKGTVSVQVTNRGDGNWQIDVHDTGIGIPEDAQESIFDEFRQADEGFSRGGTGLGLAIVRKLVLEMQGSIHLTSEVNKGSTFTVVIPLNTEAKALKPRGKA